MGWVESRRRLVQGPALGSTAEQNNLTLIGLSSIAPPAAPLVGTCGVTWRKLQGRAERMSDGAALLFQGAILMWLMSDVERMIGVLFVAALMLVAGLLIV